ncbi:hypothetical protein, partial [Larsenimonas rhizosphaerae]
FFCVQAIQSLISILPDWNVGIDPFRNGPGLIYGFPAEPPKFLGFISQKYRPINSAPAKSFQFWIDQINNQVVSGLVPVLQRAGMSVSVQAFEQGIVDRQESQEQFNLANISDFNSLIAKAHQHKIPIFSLTDSQIDQQGNVLENMKENRDNFEQLFVSLAASIQTVISLDQQGI